MKKKNVFLFSPPCIGRAIAILLAFLVFFAVVKINWKVQFSNYSLTYEVAERIFWPHIYACAAFIRLLALDGCYSCSSPALPLFLFLPAGLVSLVEARILLALANLTGKIPFIGWMGRRDKDDENGGPDSDS